MGCGGGRLVLARGGAPDLFLDTFAGKETREGAGQAYSPMSELGRGAQLLAEKLLVGEGSIGQTAPMDGELCLVARSKRMKATSA